MNAKRLDVADNLKNVSILQVRIDVKRREISVRMDIVWIEILDSVLVSHSF